MQFWYPHLSNLGNCSVLISNFIFMNSITVSAFGETEFWFAIIKVVAILVLIGVGVIPRCN